MLYNVKVCYTIPIFLNLCNINNPYYTILYWMLVFKHNSIQNQNMLCYTKLLKLYAILSYATLHKSYGQLGRMSCLNHEFSPILNWQCVAGLVDSLSIMGNQTIGVLFGTHPYLKWPLVHSCAIYVRVLIQKRTTIPNINIKYATSSNRQPRGQAKEPLCWEMVQASNVRLRVSPIHRVEALQVWITLKIIALTL